MHSGTPVVWYEDISLLICDDSTWTFINQKPVRIGGDLLQIRSAGIFRLHLLLLDHEGTIWSCSKDDNQYNNQPIWFLNIEEDANKMQWLQNIPQKINNLPAIRQISAGFGHALLLDYEAGVWGLGSNIYGQLAVNATETSFIRAPVRIQCLPEIASVHANLHCSFFVDTDRALWAVGKNNQGNLGLDDIEHKSTPEKVLIDSAVVNVVEIASCLTLVVDESSKIWFLALVDNVEWHSDCVLVPVSKTLSYIQANAKKIISMLATNGLLYVDEEGHVWGLGNDVPSIFNMDDNVMPFVAPTKIEIPGDKKVTLIAGDEKYAFFLDENGEVWGCGDNSKGQLGLVNQQVLVPEKLEGLPKIQAIYSNRGKTIFVDLEGNALGLGFSSATEISPLLKGCKLSMPRAQFTAKSARK